MYQTRASQNRAPVGVTGSYVSENEKEVSVAEPLYAPMEIAKLTASSDAMHVLLSSHGKNVVIRAWLACAVI